jgi:hypothetical protein
MLDFFPPEPVGLKGRASELDVLARHADSTSRIALVGAGGSGKSMLAAALGYRLRPRFDRRLHWFRVGAWDTSTLVEMMALRFGTSRVRERMTRELRDFLSDVPRLVVLDNHENDRAMAGLLEALSDTRATFVLTARRCLLSGVVLFPVTAPLVTTGKIAFPRVKELHDLLRANPLALDVAQALVEARATSVEELARFLEASGVSRVTAIEHEDDLPEVALLVRWAWKKLAPPSRTMLGVLARSEGDHMDEASIGALGRVPRHATRRALAPLLRWHLVQEPMPGRFALHAVVRHAVAKLTRLDPEELARRAMLHYAGLLERSPERLRTEQTHFFAAMDYAQRARELSAILRLDRLADRLEAPLGPSSQASFAARADSSATRP